MHLVPHARFAATDAHQHRHQLERIESIRLGAPRAPAHFDARRIDDPIPDASFE
jgi:hypothetical protein